MQLHVSDPSFTDRLATYLTSVGQTVSVRSSATLELDLPATASARDELDIYLRVWHVLYPEVEVQVSNDEDVPPAA